MLTRLEIDGFKNLLGVAIDFGPYTCIAGPNGVGKSNLFDAIELLSLLADHSFMEAAQRLRSAGSRSGDPRSLFSADDGDHPSLTIAAEMIVPREVEDDFGRLAQPTTSYLRYELELAYEAPDLEAMTQLGRIVLVSETLRHINLGHAASRLRWQHSKARFRDHVVFGRRSGTAYISTTAAAPGSKQSNTVNVHQDGGSNGRPRTSPADRAPRTVVATTNNSSEPTILAARREMQQWRMLALEPSAMRSPDALSDPPHIAASGAHLAGALYRLRQRGDEDTYATVASAAAALTDVRDLRVDVDRQRELLTLQARVGEGAFLPARALSDGTLRFLALCIIESDPDFGGLICMEEPENGIHPGKVSAMVDLVRDLSVDATAVVSDDNPLRQVIVNTHSPYFVQYQHAADLVLAMPTTIEREGKTRTTVRLAPLAKTWRTGTTPGVSRESIVEYLGRPLGAQLSLDLAWTA